MADGGRFLRRRRILDARDQTLGEEASGALASMDVIRDLR